MTVFLKITGLKYISIFKSYCKYTKLFFRVGSTSKAHGGRLFGVGHSHGNARSQGTQWWQMDWHADHGAESYNREDGGYHFHTQTVR